MKSLIFPCLLLVGVFFWAGDTRISWSPFRIEMPGWRLAVGLIIIGIGLAIVNVHYRIQGRQDGRKEAMGIILKALNEAQSKQDSTTQKTLREKENEF